MTLSKVDTMRLLIDSLKSCPFFAGLPQVELVQLAEVSSSTIHDPEHVIVRAGSPQQSILLLAEGKLAIYRKNVRADITLLLGSVVAPALIGDAEWAAGSPWSISIRAELESTVIAIPNDAFEAVLRGHPQVAYLLYRDACVRHLAANHTAQILGLYPVDVRLLRVLLDHARRYGARHGDEVHVGRVLSKAEVARSLGVTRQTVFRVVRQMVDAGRLSEDAEGAYIIHRVDEVLEEFSQEHLSLSTRADEASESIVQFWQGEGPKADAAGSRRR